MLCIAWTGGMPAIGHAQAPDVIVASPDLYKVMLENEHVRVVLYTLQPGQRDSVHSHPPKVSYVLSGGPLRVHLPGGTVIPVNDTTGSVAWGGPVKSHWVENVGATPVRIVLVEVKAALVHGSASARDTMPAAVVQRFVDAANARDARTMGALVATDAVFARFPGGQRMVAGRDSIEVYYGRLKSAPADFRITVQPRTVDGAFVIDQEHIVGGGRTRIATWMYEVRGGLIQRAWVFDTR
jgi:quercetin dioxygenase-like cupin family protein